MVKDAHLYACSEPLKVSGQLVGLCGKPVLEPVIQHCWDAIPVGQKLNTSELIGICAKCRKQDIDGRFVYAIGEKRYVSKEES